MIVTDSVEDLRQAAAGGAAPLAPLPTNGTMEGTLALGSIDFSFATPQSSVLTLGLELDINGDGNLEKEPLLVHLGANMVSPLTPASSRHSSLACHTFLRRR